MQAQAQAHGDNAEDGEDNEDTNWFVLKLLDWLECHSACLLDHFQCSSVKTTTEKKQTTADNRQTHSPFFSLLSPRSQKQQRWQQRL